MKIYQFFIIKAILLFFAFFSSPSIAMERKKTEATCPIEDRIYTDGKYELIFSKTESPLEISFVIKEENAARSFLGNIIYNMGYSIPNVSIQIDPCKGEGRNDLDQRKLCSCAYEGTVYEIKGDETSYGIDRDVDRYPLLFPKLGYYFHSCRHDFSPPLEIPEDVWTFKRCSKDSL